MILYSMIIFFYLNIMVILNLAYVSHNQLDASDMLLWLCIGIGIIALTSVIMSFIVRILPKSVFDANRKRFKVFNVEKSIYSFIGVKKWKRIIPDAGGITGFKHDLKMPDDLDFVEKFLFENCLSESVHFFSILLSGLMFFIIPIRFRFSLALPLFLINLILQGMPICVQRYVRPKVIKIRERLIKKQKLAAQVELETGDETVKI